MGLGAEQEVETRPAWMLLGGVLLLFTVWSCSFIAIEYLLMDGRGVSRFDWLSLTTARFAPVGVFCALYLALFKPKKSLVAIKAHWRRIAIAGLFNVMGYNFALYYAQQEGVAAPIASLMTALAPLFLMLLSAVFLSESITRRRVLGFLISLSGLGVISLSKPDSGVTYIGLVLLAACAPLSWSIYSVITKPIAKDMDSLVLTFLVLSAGTLPLMPLLYWHGGPELLVLDGEGWFALGYLSLLSTLVGFVLWTWLLRYLPASTVGFTVFLNPPMTTGYKALLAWMLPAFFAFTISGMEWLGGGIVLLGLSVAMLKKKKR